MSKAPEPKISLDKYYKGPAKPEDIARYGKCAATIRRVMKERNLLPPAVGEAIGMSRSNSSIYIWRAAKGAPGPAYRAKLAKFFGVPEADLMPVGPAAPRGKQVAQQRATPTVSTVSFIPDSAFEARPVDERLSFVMNGSGTAKIALNVELPLDRAATLFQILLQELQTDDRNKLGQGASGTDD